MQQQDIVLTRAVALLGKRDGIDKVLKVIRYTAKLLLATRGYSRELKALDSSLGTTRKALRLGKFLGNVQDLNALGRNSSDLTSALLTALAATGEGAYYFIDQFVWLIKAGALPARLEERFSRASAWCELLGYVGAISLRVIQLRAVTARLKAFDEMVVMTIADRCSSTSSVTSMASQLPSGDDDMVVKARRQLRETSAARDRLLLLLLKDASDALITVQELLGTRAVLASPRTLALCGVVSGAISLYKLW